VAATSPLWDVSVSGFHAGGGVASLPVSAPDVPVLVPARPPHPRIHAEVGRYRLRLAETVADRDAIAAYLTSIIPAAKSASSRA